MLLWDLEIFLQVVYNRFYIGVQLINNDVLAISVQQSDSLYLYKYPLVFNFFSHLNCYRILSQVPRAIPQTLSIICRSVYMSIANSQSTSQPLHQVRALVSLHLFCKYFICIFLLDSACQHHHMVFVLLWPPSLILISRSVAVAADGTASVLLTAE